MKKLLVDTSVIIDFLRSLDKEKTLYYQLSQNELYISLLTHTELFGGRSVWESKKARNALVDIFTGVTIISLTEEISEMAGKIKAYNHDRSLLDCIIAATSLCNNLELATLNVKDFEHIKKLELFSEVFPPKS